MNKRTVPPPLPAGAHIRVIAPAGSSKPELLQHGTSELTKLGYQVSCSPGCSIEPEHRGEAFLAAPDEIRSKDLIQAICKTDCDAVMVTRGGYGTMRLLDAIPYPGVEKKWITGFSDLTALSLALYEKRKLVTLSGPVVAASNGFDANGITMNTWKNWVGEAQPQSYSVTVEKSGTANGVLLGGCLSLIAAISGTRYSPSYQNAILLLEDVGEDEYSIDRMLVQLALGGVFKRVVGVIVGQFCTYEGVIEPQKNAFTARRVTELVGKRRVPVVSGFPYGHFSQRVTVPIGGDAKIFKNTITLSLTERKA